MMGEMDSFDGADGAGEHEFLEFDGAMNWEMATEEVADLAPLIESMRLPLAPEEVYFHLEGISLNEDELDYEALSKLEGELTRERPIRIESVVVDVAHVEHFPKDQSSYASSFPSIFAWCDVRSAFSSEFRATVQNYFKVSYNLIKPQIGFSFAISPSSERLKSLIRSGRPSDRVLFHYAGYGFPRITDSNMWCSERQTGSVTPLPLAQLFEKVRAPSFFVFDCSNAGVVIDAFSEAAEKLTNTGLGSDVDWNDWMCLCATSKGEELPDDSRLPKDFLTAALLAPVRTSVICHVLQYYRRSLVTATFPLDVPFSQLWNDKSVDGGKLVALLEAITSAVAADMLPSHLYEEWLMGDPLKAVLFKRFMLAQYLLRPYHVHPVARPAVPDLSVHHLWSQWGITLDMAVCAVSNGHPGVGTYVLGCATSSLEELMRSEQFNEIRPIHISLTFSMFVADPSNDHPLNVLAEYALDPRCQRKLILQSLSFQHIFTRLLSVNPRQSVFSHLCFLAAIILSGNPTAVNDLPKNIDMEWLPSVMFMHDVPTQSRMACTGLVASLITKCEAYQRICTSREFIEDVSSFIIEGNVVIGTWVLLLITRAFSVFSPDASIFAANGLHLKCAIGTTGDTPVTRAAAVATLSCFMSSFECMYNTQLFLMSLQVVGDASFIVRFQMVVLLRKFVNSFEDVSKMSCEDFANVSFSSFSALCASILRDGTRKDFFARIDALMKEENCSAKAFAFAMFLLKMYGEDPDNGVRSLAKKVIEFAAQRRGRFERAADIPMDSDGEMGMDVLSYGDDDFEEDEGGFDESNYVGALHRIALRLMVITQFANRVPSTTCHLPIVGTYSLAKDTIRFIEFIPAYDAVVAVTRNTIFFIAGRETRSYTFTDQELCDVQPVTQAYRPRILFTTTNGCFYFWNPRRARPDISGRIDPRIEKRGIMHVRWLESRSDFAALREDGNLSIWDLARRILKKEIILTLSARAVLFDVYEDVAIIGCTDGNILTVSITEGRVTQTIHYDEELIGVTAVGGDITMCKPDGTWHKYTDSGWVPAPTPTTPRYPYGSGGSLIGHTSAPENSTAYAIHSSGLAVFGTNTGDFIVRAKSES